MLPTSSARTTEASNYVAFTSAQIGDLQGRKISTVPRQGIKWTEIVAPSKLPAAAAMERQYTKKEIDDQKYQIEDALEIDIEQHNTYGVVSNTKIKPLHAELRQFFYEIRKRIKIYEHSETQTRLANMLTEELLFHFDHYAMLIELAAEHDGQLSFIQPFLIEKIHLIFEAFFGRKLWLTVGCYIETHKLQDYLIQLDKKTSPEEQKEEELSKKNRYFRNINVATLWTRYPFATYRDPDDYERDFGFIDSNNLRSALRSPTGVLPAGMVQYELFLHPMKYLCEYLDAPSPKSAYAQLLSPKRKMEFPEHDILDKLREMLNDSSPSSHKKYLQDAYYHMDHLVQLQQYLQKMQLNNFQSRYAALLWLFAATFQRSMETLGKSKHLEDTHNVRAFFHFANCDENMRKLIEWVNIQKGFEYPIRKAEEGFKLIDVMLEANKISHHAIMQGEGELPETIAQQWRPIDKFNKLNNLVSLAIETMSKLLEEFD